MTKTLVQQARVRTNTIKDSVCKIDVPVVKFTDLWDNYVTGTPYRDPKTGAAPPGFDNQCALRMSATFHKVGVRMLSFSPKTVKPAPGLKNLGVVKLDGLPGATRAYELGQWLRLQPFCGLPQKPEDITGKEWEAQVKGRTGIIMFHAYWTRDEEQSANATGGHIDLWNGSRLTISGFADAWATIGRYLGRRSFRQGATVLPDLAYSDLGGSRLILFWEVK
jgi:hypothetical protein